jgi:hypothetical protein
LAVAQFLFYLYGWLWTLRPRRVGSEGDVEVIRLDDGELVTRCRNPCPIL